MICIWFVFLTHRNTELEYNDTIFLVKRGSWNCKKLEKLWKNANDTLTNFRKTDCFMNILKLNWKPISCLYMICRLITRFSCFKTHWNANSNAMIEFSVGNVVLETVKKMEKLWKHSNDTLTNFRKTDCFMNSLKHNRFSKKYYYSFCVKRINQLKRAQSIWSYKKKFFVLKIVIFEWEGGKEQTNFKLRGPWAVVKL